MDSLFENTESKILSQAESIKAVVLKGFSGLIGKKFSQEEDSVLKIASYAKKRGVSGIFHSDELPAYGITQDEVNSVKDYFEYWFSRCIYYCCT